MLGRFTLVIEGTVKGRIVGFATREEAWAAGTAMDDALPAGTGWQVVREERLPELTQAAQAAWQKVCTTLWDRYNERMTLQPRSVALELAQKGLVEIVWADQCRVALTDLGKTLVGKF